MPRSAYHYTQAAPPRRPPAPRGCPARKPTPYRALLGPEDDPPEDLEDTPGEGLVAPPIDEDDEGGDWLA